MTRDKPGPPPPKRIHRVPAGQNDRHDRRGTCPCGPAVERWTVEGRTEIRIVHRHLQEEAPRAEDVLPGPSATVGVDR